jgi:hypothetical protein
MGALCGMELLVEKFELDAVEFFKTKFTALPALVLSA